MDRYSHYDPNPRKNGRVGDCVVRALSKALGQTWEQTYWDLCDAGFEFGDWGSSDTVWSAYLHGKGFTRHAVPAEYSGRYTVEDFAEDHPFGTYVLWVGGHVVCVKDGRYFDSWRSGNEVPHLYWERMGR